MKKREKEKNKRNNEKKHKKKQKTEKNITKNDKITENTKNKMKKGRGLVFFSKSWMNTSRYAGVDTCMHDGSSWLSWLLLAPPGSSWLLLAPLGSSWLLLALLGCSWLLLSPPGSSWLLLAPPDSSWQGGAKEAQWGFSSERLGTDPMIIPQCKTG